MGTCARGSWRTRRFQCAREEIQRISLDERTSRLARPHRGNGGARYHCDLYGKMKMDIGASPRHNYFVDLTHDEFLELIELRLQTRFGQMLGSGGCFTATPRT